eukprot:CAMPEP_0184694388 /NCGR_PEP_ID=MMETSP0313-20130426/2374_1 /TAXON_ID=2792 /ORGANISM="Porphyridium aerugineum, Strain SAG 1380-2" /LENGTH=607 /DNA_ID=CAMNT_0027152679 /DNA_START=279 /DNA_END=2102 /DNA_ORIENTATION=+
MLKRKHAKGTESADSSLCISSSETSNLKKSPSNNSGLLQNDAKKKPKIVKLSSSSIHIPKAVLDAVMVQQRSKIEELERKLSVTRAELHVLRAQQQQSKDGEPVAMPTSPLLLSPTSTQSGLLVERESQMPMSHDHAVEIQNRQEQEQEREQEQEDHDHDHDHVYDDDDDDDDDDNLINNMVAEADAEATSVQVEEHVENELAHVSAPTTELKSDDEASSEEEDSAEESSDGDSSDESVDEDEHEEESNEKESQNQPCAKKYKVDDRMDQELKEAKEEPKQEPSREPSQDAAFDEFVHDAGNGQEAEQANLPASGNGNENENGSVPNSPRSTAPKHASAPMLMSLMTSPRSASGSPPRKRSLVSSPQLDGQSRYWTAAEHERFLEGLRKFGTKNFAMIAQYVGTRTTQQVRSHAQKFELRLAKENGDATKQNVQTGQINAGFERFATHDVKTEALFQPTGVAAAAAHAKKPRAPRTKRPVNMATIQSNLIKPTVIIGNEKTIVTREYLEEDASIMAEPLHNSTMVYPNMSPVSVSDGMFGPILMSDMADSMLMSMALQPSSHFVEPDSDFVDILMESHEETDLAYPLGYDDPLMMPRNLDNTLDFVW